MKQEYITSVGKVINEREVLYFRNLDLRFHHTIFYELFVPVGWVFLAIVHLVVAIQPFDYFKGILFSILAILHGYPIYDILVRRSLSTRIPLKNIVSFEMKETMSNLETDVILHLRSGRYKKIAFRTLEKQYEPFIELISQYTIQPQKA